MKKVICTATFSYPIPYGVSDYMDKVFERLSDMGFNGQE